MSTNSEGTIPVPERQERLTAWGRSSHSVSSVRRISSSRDVASAVGSGAPQHGVLARGLARSYGDVCLNDGGRILDTTAFDRIESFDESEGTLVCQAGASYNSIMRRCLPLGWLPPVCPGTSFVTMGGAIANDVHGKNQHVEGSFGDHLDWFDLRLPCGELRRVRQETDAELYAATVGGIGLTGVIEALQFKLRRAPSNAVELTEQRIPDIDTFLERLQASETTHPHVVGWLDALQSGRHMGRGILELASPASGGVREPSPLSVSVPFEFPSSALNRHSVRLFNALYFRHVPAAGRSRRVHLDKFLYPLDAIHNWNRMYGRKGIYQFQCVVPFAEGRRAIIELMDEIVRSRGASFLAVLKSMSRESRGMIAFPMPGFTLALDFPRREGTLRLIERLHDIVLKYGGRIYLAKDATLSAERFAAMYPRAQEFKSLLQRIDPELRMQSDMSRRLGLSPR